MEAPKRVFASMDNIYNIKIKIDVFAATTASYGYLMGF